MCLICSKEVANSLDHNSSCGYLVINWKVVEVAMKILEYFPKFTWKVWRKLGNISVTAASETGLFNGRLPRPPTTNFECSIITPPTTQRYGTLDTIFTRWITALFFTWWCNNKGILLTIAGDMLVLLIQHFFQENYWICQYLLIVQAHSL